MKNINYFIIRHIYTRKIIAATHVTTRLDNDRSFGDNNNLYNAHVNIYLLYVRESIYLLADIYIYIYM